MKQNSKNEIQAFVDQMSEVYRNKTASDSPTAKPKKPFKREEFFGLITMYIGIAPVIIVKSSSDFWTPLAVSLCLICIAVGACQITLKQIQAKQTEFGSAK